MRGHQAQRHPHHGDHTRRQHRAALPEPGHDLPRLEVAEHLTGPQQRDDQRRDPDEAPSSPARNATTGAAAPCPIPNTAAGTNTGPRAPAGGCSPPPPGQARTSGRANRFAGRGRPRCSRSVVPVYPSRNSPRSRRIGTTVAVNVSSPSG